MWNVQFKSPTIQPDPGKFAEVELSGRVKVSKYRPMCALDNAQLLWGFWAHPLDFGIKISVWWQLQRFFSTTVTLSVHCCKSQDFSFHLLKGRRKFNPDLTVRVRALNMKCCMKAETSVPKSDYNSTTWNYNSPSVLWKNGWRYIYGLWITNNFWLKYWWPFWGGSCVISFIETNLLQINSAIIGWGCFQAKLSFPSPEALRASVEGGKSCPRMIKRPGSES